MSVKPQNANQQPGPPTTPSAIHFPQSLAKNSITRRNLLSSSLKFRQKSLTNTPKLSFIGPIYHALFGCLRSSTKKRNQSRSGTYSRATAHHAKYAGQLKASFSNVHIKRSAKSKKFRNTWMSKSEVKVAKLWCMFNARKKLIYIWNICHQLSVLKYFVRSIGPSQLRSKKTGLFGKESIRSISSSRGIKIYAGKTQKWLDKLKKISMNGLTFRKNS